MPLVDTGLVCRYFIDEAASGTSPTAVDDKSSNAYDLDTINYGSGNMSYSEPSANQRGLESTATSGVQRAVHAITASDAVDTALDGSKVCTFEIVIRVDSFISDTRIFGINDRVGSTGKLILRAGSATTWRFAINDGSAITSIDWSLTTRSVLHIVVDTAEATEGDRIKIYQDNVLDITGQYSIAQNTTFSLSAGSSDLIAFNRENSGSFDASFDGELFYAAIYDGVLSSGDRTTNFNILTSDDDAPAAAAASIIPQIMHHRKLLRAS